MTILRRDFLKSAAIIPLISIIPILAIIPPIEEYFEYRWVTIKNINLKVLKLEGWEPVSKVIRKTDGTLHDKYRPMPSSSKYGNTVLMHRLKNWV